MGPQGVVKLGNPGCSRRPQPWPWSGKASQRKTKDKTGDPGGSDPTHEGSLSQELVLLDHGVGNVGALPFHGGSSPGAQRGTSCPCERSGVIPPQGGCRGGGQGGLPSRGALSGTLPGPNSASTYSILAPGVPWGPRSETSSHSSPGSEGTREARGLEKMHLSFESQHEASKEHVARCLEAAPSAQPGPVATALPVARTVL